MVFSKITIKVDNIFDQLSHICFISTVFRHTVLLVVTKIGQNFICIFSTTIFQWYLLLSRTTVSPDSTMVICDNQTDSLPFFIFSVDQLTVSIFDRPCAICMEVFTLRVVSLCHPFMNIYVYVTVLD